MKENTRRGFIKLLSMSAIAIVLPKPVERIKITATSNADRMIGINSVERMRITQSGHIMIHTIADVGMAGTLSSKKLDI